LINVSLCVPSMNTMNAGFVNSLFGLTKFSQGRMFGDEAVDLRLLNVRTSILPLSRTALVKYAIANEARYMLFMDSDMTFPKDALFRLMSHRAPVVGTVASRRDGKGLSALYDPTVPRTGLVNVDRLGTGFMMLEAKIFHTLPKPWFDLTMSEENLPPDEWDKECEGEDVFLSYRLREAGIPLLLDWDLSMQIGHLGEMEYRLKA